MKWYKKGFGFTLVELIVVITIVGILSTIGFVSYSGYLTGARDSNRTSQMVKLSDSLQVYSATKSLPLPDNYIEIQSSGSLVAYQGEVGVDVLETIDYTNGGTDPKDGSYYTYYLTKDRNSMQLMAMMEEESLSVNNLSPSFLSYSITYATDYEDRFPSVYGKKLGTLTDTSNTPVQEITTLQTLGLLEINDGGSYIANVDKNEQIEGTGSQLISHVASSLAGDNLKSCKEILDSNTLFQGIDGVYSISSNSDTYKSYCDMTTDGGGWTLLFNTDGPLDFDKTTIGKNKNFLNTNGINTAYSEMKLGTDLLLELKNGDISGEISDSIASGDTRVDIIYDISTSGDTLYYYANTIENTKVFETGQTTTQNLSNNSLFGGDYGGTGGVDSSFCLNDRENSNVAVTSRPGFVFGKCFSSNSAGWPNYTSYSSLNYNTHWSTNFRVWSR